MLESDAVNFKENSVSPSTGRIAYLAGGTGKPIVYLHHSWGSPGALQVHGLLAEHHQVFIPDMPGWSGSERPAWARDVRDIAILTSRFIDSMNLEEMCLVGVGFDGYVTMELASMNPSRLTSLVLIGASGLQPDEGEIMDQMMLSHRRYIELSYCDHDSYVHHFGKEPVQELRELWDHSREMTARVSWKPYFFNRRLGPLLGDTNIPTLLI